MGSNPDSRCVCAGLRNMVTSTHKHRIKCYSLRSCSGIKMLSLTLSVCDVGDGDARCVSKICNELF